MAEWLASPDWDRKVVVASWVRLPVSLGVMGSDGICKYFIMFKFNPMLLYACVLCFGLYYLSYGIVDTWRLAAA